jgi:nicotinamidase-related amidase
MAGSTALLVIDVQNAMFDDSYPPYLGSETRDVIAGLIEKARLASVPVIYVQHEDLAYEPMQPGHRGFEIHADVAPIDGEPVVRKQASDSFSGTDLKGRLDSLDVTNLVITGLQTEYCIDTTCRSAMSQGYDVTLVADGHTTCDSQTLNASQIIASHNEHLAGLPHPQHRIEVRDSREISFDAP